MGNMDTMTSITQGGVWTIAYKVSCGNQKLQFYRNIESKSPFPSNNINGGLHSLKSIYEAEITITLIKIWVYYLF